MSCDSFWIGVGGNSTAEASVWTKALAEMTPMRPLLILTDEFSTNAGTPPRWRDSIDPFGVDVGPLGGGAALYGCNIPPDGVPVALSRAHGTCLRPLAVG